MSSEVDQQHDSKAPIKKIPYGASNYQQIVNKELYYVDKTHFIPLLEDLLFTFLIRPRRMGKSLWLSTIENYYDVATTDQFDTLFGNTWIGQNPTKERNSYLVLRLDFSSVDTDPANVQQDFNFRGGVTVHSFLDKYSAAFTESLVSQVHAREALGDKLHLIFTHLSNQDEKLYLLIDEYDNFSNTILSSVGTKAYHKLTKEGGFYRQFFSTLKTGTATGVVDRLFITGVSPVTMDDVTSGFNIGRNISLFPEFQQVLGFSESETLTLLQYYASRGVLKGDVQQHLAVMRPWYNHYRFSEKSESSVYNTDMVLHYVDLALRSQDMPDKLIDHNVQIDYSKLRYLLQINARQKNTESNGNFNVLQQIISDGGIASQVVESFPLERITKRSNFVSLLYYFGLLTYSDVVRSGKPFLKIPNQVIQTLMYGYIRDTFEDSQMFTVDIERLSDLVEAMAFEGQWQPVFEFLAQRLQEQTAIRDYLEGEKTVQVFLRTYLHIIDFFITQAEAEMNKGFSDIVLEPFLTRYPDMTHAYVIEVKYIPRAINPQDALQTAVNSAREAAQSQLTQYGQDASLLRRCQGLTLHKLMVVFHGWELVLCEEAV